MVAGKIMLVYKWLPGPFGIAMIAGFTAFVLVSLITKPESDERINRFFDNMRRKSDAEPGPDGKKPIAAETGDDLLLLDLPGWAHKSRWENFYKRYREDIAGFLLSWVFVGALILLAWGILQL
jgi:hypothetical protein